jgi:hypothetical protein
VDAAAHGDRYFRAAAVERPGIPAEVAGAEDAVVRSEVGRRFCRAARLQVSGRGDQHALQRHQLAGAEGGVVEFAEADGDVGAFGEQILARIDHGHFHPQQRMHLQKFRQPRNDLAGAVDHGDRKPDDAAERIEAARGVLGVLDLAQDFSGAVEKQRAGIGHRDAARGPQQ